MANLSGRVALIYDSVNKWGGAEVVLTALNQLFPRAPLFTSVYSPRNAAWASVFPEVIPSFLQHFPFAANHRDFYPFLTPLAFESLNLSGFDTVISVTSADAKGVVTSPRTFHLCYCLTPTRYYWSHHEAYRQTIPWLLRPLSRLPFSYGRNWDLTASSRPDAYLAISRTVQERIKMYYHRDSEIVYPPVPEDVFDHSPLPASDRQYFLYVGRMVSYKQPEMIVKTFNQLGLPLVMAGSGPLLPYLRSIARSNIQLPGFVNRGELLRLYRHARALLFVHEEDFGITAVESMGCGTPVIGINRGGVAETVLNGKTGLLLPHVDIEVLARTVSNFIFTDYDVQLAQTHAREFSWQRFLSQFKRALVWEAMKFKNTSSS